MTSRQFPHSQTERTISVAREAKYQNMEFLDNKSRKPYESQLKPLLGWWKAFRGGHMAESSAPPDSRCSLNSVLARCIGASTF